MYGNQSPFDIFDFKCLHHLFLNFLIELEVSFDILDHLKVKLACKYLLELLNLL